MALGASMVENFITRVSMDGVERVTAGQKMLGAGFRSLKGDIGAMGAAAKSMKLDGMGMLAVGGAMTAAGAGMMMYLRSVTQAGIQAEEVEVRLRTALLSSGKIREQSIEGLSKYAASLSALTGRSPFGDEEVRNALAVLGSFKLNEDQLRALLPRILDISWGLKRMGKEGAPSLEQIAIMLGKATTEGGMIMSLRRIGIMVDQNAFKARGWRAVVEEIDKEFRGQAQAGAKTYAGSIATMNEEINEFNESMAAGVLPLIKTANTIGGPLVNAFTAFNHATHGAAGFLTAVGAGTLVVGGAIMMVMPGIMALRNYWLEVAAAANTATVAQTQAAEAAWLGALTGGAKLDAVTAGKAGMGLKGRLAVGALGIGATIGGGLLQNWGQGAVERMKTEGKTGALKTQAAFGNVGGSALTGAGIGAMIGSVVPVIGTAVGAAVGGIIGAGAGLYGARRDRNAVDEALAGPRARNPQLSAINKGIEDLVALTRAQNNVIIGSDRKALTTGDLQRGFTRVLMRGMA